MAVGAAVLIAAALISAMATTTGSAIAANKNEQSVRETNEANAKLNTINNAFNAEQAQIQRDYETEMSNTAYQRRVADLKAAGLNPALAVTSGASFTPGATAASNSSPVAMKAVDYSPLAQISANLGHLVTSAARIHALNNLTQQDPKTMAQLSKVASKVNNSITSSNYGDISDAELNGLINKMHSMYK